MLRGGRFALATFPLDLDAHEPSATNTTTTMMMAMLMKAGGVERRAYYKLLRHGQEDRLREGTGCFHIITAIVIVIIVVVVIVVIHCWTVMFIKQLRVGVEMLVQWPEADPLPVVVLLEVRLQRLW